MSIEFLFVSNDLLSAVAHFGRAAMDFAAIAFSVSRGILSQIETGLSFLEGQNDFGHALMQLLGPIAFFAAPTTRLEKLLRAQMGAEMSAQMRTKK